MMTLDTISLLLSKETPAPAGPPPPPAPRAPAGPGPPRAAPLAPPLNTEARRQENKTIATGWKRLDMEMTMDSIVTSVSRRHKEIELETKYWAEVLAVSDNGWSVSRLASDKDTLGVKFGFSEAAPEFRNTSSAPMRRSDKGTVILDTGRVGQPKRILVTVERDGSVVGRSSLPKPLREDAPLEDRVLEARNTVFSQELWHEINREGRSLLSYGVQLEKSALSVRIDQHTRIIITLQVLADHEASPASGPEDSFAESVHCALQLLLAYAHRQNNQRRSQPSQAGNQNRATQGYYLLRPVIAHLIHEASLRKAVRFMSDLTGVLQAAGLSTASYTLTEPPTSLYLPTTSHRASASEALCASLLSPREFLFELAIIPDARISVRGKTIPFPAATQYLVQLVAPPGGDTTSNPPGAPPQDKARNPLQWSFPPTDQYPDLREVIYYVRQAVAHVLAVRAKDQARELTPQAEGDQIEWIRTVNGKSICDMDDQFRSIRFDICRADAVEDDDGLHQPEPDLSGGGDGPALELRVSAAWPVEGDQIGKVAKQKWRWTAEGSSLSASLRRLDDIVAGCLSGELKPNESNGE